jgi:Predicted membrane protein
MSEDTAPRPRRSLFGGIYRRLQGAARHPHAQWWLAAAAFAEASFFPIPPDVILAPMALESPKRWWRYATIATVSSAIGGLFGYAIGHYLIEWALPLIQAAGYGGAYHTAKVFFARYGFWALIVKGLTPFPYKIFTITAGAVAMPLLPFFAASVISRAMRFFLLAGLLALAGPKVEPVLARYIDWFGWAFLALLVVGFWWLAQH